MKRRITLDRVIEIVAREEGLLPGHIKNASRTVKLVKARMRCYVLGDMLGYSVKEIARAMCKDQSTVRAALRRFQKDVDSVF